MCGAKDPVASASRCLPASNGFLNFFAIVLSTSSSRCGNGMYGSAPPFLTPSSRAACALRKKCTAQSREGSRGVTLYGLRGNKNGPIIHMSQLKSLQPGLDFSINASFHLLDFPLTNFSRSMASIMDSKPSK